MKLAPKENTPQELRGQTWKKEIQIDIPFLKVILLTMARPIRIVYEGAVYHITIRGNERRPIFKNDEDRSYFIAKLAEREASQGQPFL